MARCKWCDRSGWLLSLNPAGLCSGCAPLIGLDVTQRVRILTDSVVLVETGKSLETRLSRCDLVIDHARSLARYEERGISVLNVSPSTLATEYKQKRKQLIVDGLTSELTAAKAKARAAATPRTQVNSLSKVLLKIQSYRAVMPDLVEVAALEREASALITDTQLAEHLDNARKFEFKGQKAKALDRYYEALYLLRHDAIPDEMQREHISPIEAKIRELGGEIR